MRAIHVDANGMLTALDLDGATPASLTEEVNDLLGSDWYDVASLADGVDLLIDAEGALLDPEDVFRLGRPATRQQFNPVLSTIAHGLGRTAIFHGPGVFIGHDDHGNPAGLTPTNVALIVSRWCTASTYKAVTVAELLSH